MSTKKYSTPISQKFNENINCGLLKVKVKDVSIQSTVHKALKKKDDRKSSMGDEG